MTISAAAIKQRTTREFQDWFRLALDWIIHVGDLDYTCCDRVAQLSMWKETQAMRQDVAESPNKTIASDG